MVDVNRSLYVICPKGLFDSKYDKYLAKGFDNRGAIRYNNNETKVLIEEAAGMFNPDDLKLPGVQVFETDEILPYLNQHGNEWEPETE